MSVRNLVNTVRQMRRNGLSREALDAVLRDLIAGAGAGIGNAHCNIHEGFLSGNVAVTEEVDHLSELVVDAMLDCLSELVASLD